MVGLHELKHPPRRRRRRRGRGNAAGRGTYAGRGIKGQRARSGGRRGLARRSLKALFERLPKVRGMTVAKTRKPRPVQLATIAARFEPSDRVTRAALIEAKLLPASERRVVVLGGGKVGKALTVFAHRFSKTAARAITDAGGRAVTLRARRPRAKRRAAKH